ncbi:hypothetical protein KEJ45_01295 [Candidatus Bathyarchaeota archaeon]|nr:hypothetical protein [Candidatus Bathyarchaeota archaeon]
MAGSTIDHLISLTVFLAALLLFISLFNNMLQTAILYQRHKYLATKCSDLLDNMLLTPGIPANWSKLNVNPVGFGLQDPEFTQYQLSPFSLMRLQYSPGEPIYYRGTNQWYSNITLEFGDFLLVSSAKALNYSYVAKLLGINNTYGFQLTLTPIVDVKITETRAGEPLTIDVMVTGKSFPLANAEVSYCFLKVITQGSQSPPAYQISYGSAYTNENGVATLSFSGVNSGDAYTLIACARLSGLVGVGFHQRVTGYQNYVIPFVESIEDGRVILAHSYDVHNFDSPESAVFFNATFIHMSEDFTFHIMENYQEIAGNVNYSKSQYANITLPLEPGILVVTYQSNNEYGVVLMPWGLSSMAFPVIFGGNPANQEWVATDTRQVLVDKIAYEAKLALWSLEGYGVIG